MLTSRQHEAYRFVRQYIMRHGIAPDLLEICRAMKVNSKSLIHRWLRLMDDEGLLEVSPGRERGIRLKSKGLADRPAVLPLFGMISAGKPTEAISNPDELDLSALLGGADRFALKVRGESMIEEGILSGDYVIVKAQQQARSGTIVAVLIDGTETTVKRFKRERDGKITLHPANAAMKPQTYNPERIEVQGVVVGQVRTYKQ